MMLGRYSYYFCFLLSTEIAFSLALHEFCIFGLYLVFLLQLAIEENKKFRDRNIFIILVPNKALSQKAQEPPKKKDKQVVDEVSTGV